ncbi:MAG: ogr/Delta-like zinc finger family protein [Burkholderiales bacterium]|nr:ogr/Delta-like zinc finger family protein [Burkholderiales bacterium]
MRFRCPHCETISTVRTSETMSPTVTWMYVQCGNLNCGHTWRVDAEASVTISPSARPNPRVVLPLSSHVQRDALRAQMERSPTAVVEPVGAKRMPLFDPPPLPTG